MPLILYDLAGADAKRRFSPYCWRVRMALAHKDLPVRTISWRYTEKDRIAPSGQSRVPVLVDGERWVTDSWSIAQYLEDAYSDRPPRFGDSSSRALSRLHSTTADAVVDAIFPFVALDI
ncbi:MAG TPA: glutathione S-transferase N-terminal domain-containing protein, partial [Xanthobacteraceae bacterium]|nr:glutathione S-transferase N-terminal domain-containing protein [Xanthobacteraceae bacterium]